MTQRVIVVASDAPAAPIAGAPNSPVISSQLSAALSRLAESAIVMPVLGRPIPSRKNEVAMYMRVGGMPRANMASARPPPAARLGPCPSHSRTARDTERHEPDGTTLGRLAGAVGLGGQHDRADQKADPDDQQRDVRRQADGVVGQRLGARPAGHDAVHRDHDDQP